MGKPMGWRWASRWAIDGQADRLAMGWRWAGDAMGWRWAKEKGREFVPPLLSLFSRCGLYRCHHS